jgi:hypothetical protein
MFLIIIIHTSNRRAELLTVVLRSLEFVIGGPIGTMRGGVGFIDESLK